jgi:hypothetical protein
LTDLPIAIGDIVGLEELNVSHNDLDVSAALCARQPVVLAAASSLQRRSLSAWVHARRAV